MQVRSLTCPNCGGRTRLVHGESVAACMHCGQEIRLSHAVLEEQQRGRMFPSTTPLRLGMKGQYRGREYELTGRMVLRQTADDTVYTWEEWTMVAPDGHLMYLEFDEGKWKLSEPFVPQYPLDAAMLASCVSGRSLNLEGIPALVNDTGTMQVVHAEGEFPWLVFIGRPAQFIDATSGNLFYSIEQSADAVEYYKGQFVDERQVFTIFGQTDLLRKLDVREKVLRGRRSFGVALLGASILAFFIWCFSMADGGKLVPGASGTVRLNTVGDDGVRFGPFALNTVDRVYRLEIEGQMREQSNWVGAVLEDEAEQELIPVDRDMWDESGYDSDGGWHESDLGGSTNFVLKKPGNYYIRLYAEPEPGHKPDDSVVASFRLREKVWYPNYLGYYMLCTLLFGLGFVMAGAPSQVKSAWQKMKEASDDD